MEKTVDYNKVFEIQDKNFQQLVGMSRRDTLRSIYNQKSFHNSLALNSRERSSDLIQVELVAKDQEIVESDHPLIGKRYLFTIVDDKVESLKIIGEEDMNAFAVKYNRFVEQNARLKYRLAIKDLYNNNRVFVAKNNGKFVRFCRTRNIDFPYTRKVVGDIEYATMFVGINEVKSKKHLFKDGDDLLELKKSYFFELIADIHELLD